MALRDLAKMLRILTSLDSVGSMLANYPELKDMSQWMIKAVEFMAKVQSGYVDQITA